MLAATAKMGFAGLLAAVLIGLLEQWMASPMVSPMDFDAVILDLPGSEGGVSLTLRWGIVGLASMVGQWIKRRAGADEIEPTEERTNA